MYPLIGPTATNATYTVAPSGPTATNATTYSDVMLGPTAANATTYSNYNSYNDRHQRHPTMCIPTFADKCTELGFCDNFFQNDRLLFQDSAFKFDYFLDFCMFSVNLR